MTLPDSANPFLRLKARGLILWSLMAFVILVVGLALASAAFRFRLEDPLVFPILYCVFFGVLCLYPLGQSRPRLNFKQTIGPLPPGWGWLTHLLLVLPILVFSLSAFLLSFYLLSFIAPTFVESVLKQQILQPESQTVAPLLYRSLMVLTVVVVAPIAEEFLFRGILFQRWAVKWGVRPALLLSSLVFGILHANVVGLTLFGVMMGLFYLQTRTLIVPILCHALNNALAMSMELFSSDSAQTITTLEEFRKNWWVGLVLLALSAPWLIRYILRNYPRKSAPLPYFANASRNT